MKTPENYKKAIDEIVKIIQYFQYSDALIDKYMKRDFRPR